METTALSDRLRRGIEEDILAGRLAPGDRLDERSLAVRYGVSRTPVREALLQLSMLGLVTTRGRLGNRIASFELTDLVQMFEVMALLEGQAARLAARRGSAEQKRDLLALQTRAEPIVAAEDAPAFNELNWRLHLAIFAASQNAFLAEQARNLRLRLHPYRCFLVRVTGRMATAHAEHAAIVEAIVSGRGDQAFERMVGHLAIGADELADFVAILSDGQRAAEAAASAAAER